MTPGEGTPPVALVTGSHRRLGGHIALALARRGYAVAIHGSHDVDLDPWLAEGLAGAGARWHGFVADFEDPSTAPRLMEDVAAHFGVAPRLLVNSAAMFGQDRLDDVTADDLSRHYAVNCIAPVLLGKAFAAMTAGEDRSIVNILDQRLANPHGDQLSYTLSKQALAGFTQIAARELASRGIRVNAVAPGLTIPVDEAQVASSARMAAMMPLSRLPEPAQIADAMLFLAGAPSVTGQVIAVDGGAHMRAFTRDFLYL